MTFDRPAPLKTIQNPSQVHPHKRSFCFQEKMTQKKGETAGAASPKNTSQLALVSEVNTNGEVIGFNIAKKASCTSCCV
jgi:hypothetical protein